MLTLCQRREKPLGMTKSATRSLVFLLLLVLGIHSPYANAAAAKIIWYGEGEKTISLAAISENLSYSMPLKGKTDLKTIVIMVQKNGGLQKSSVIPLDAEGTFSLEYLFREGPGKYAVTLFGSPKPNSLSYDGLAGFSVTVRTKVPEKLPGKNLNARIIDYVGTVMGTQVNTGECWDLAQQALDLNGADWVRVVQFGRELNSKKDKILPGDIVQFKSVQIARQFPDGSSSSETYGAPDHTAIVYEVLGQKRFKLAHQNVAGKRVVMVTEVDFNYMVSGSYWVYRPAPRMLFP